MAIESLIGQVAAPILGGIIGNIFSSGDRAEAEKLMGQAYDEINKVGAAPDIAREIILNKFKSAGMYKPELEQAITLGQSKVEQIRTDPSLREAQLGALAQLKQLSDTGFGAQDRAALNKIQNESARSQQAKQQQIIQEMRQRGMGTSGAGIAAALMASQEGANAEADAADRIAAQAAARSLDSIRMGTDLAGNIRSKDFSEEETRASAADRINQFNVQNSIGMQQRNVGSQNQAMLSNLDREQSAMDRNAEAQNREYARQRDAQLSQYNANLNRTNLIANATTNRANQKMNQAGNTANTISGIGQGVGQVFAALRKKESKKTDDEELDEELDEESDEG